MQSEYTNKLNAKHKSKSIEVISFPSLDLNTYALVNRLCERQLNTKRKDCKDYQLNFHLSTFKSASHQLDFKNAKLYNNHLK